jgi:hypothetical protein
VGVIRIRVMQRWMSIEGKVAMLFKPAHTGNLFIDTDFDTH